MANLGESFDNNINPQLVSPLFNRVPAEIRNYIFQLSLTSFDDKTRPYEKGAYYYRPDYRYAQKIDTSLLLTCRRIYWETDNVSATINEHTSWYQRAPTDVTKNELSVAKSPGALKRRSRLKTLHLFTQQIWLEGTWGGPPWSLGFRSFTRQWKSRYEHVQCLKITIRHSDWWYWEDEAPIGLDPQRRGRTLADDPPSHSFDENSWGAQFGNIQGLKRFQLELETLEQKKSELDAIVSRAIDWSFPLGDGHTLVMDPSQTRRTGWCGLPIGTRSESDSDQDEPSTPLPNTEVPEAENTNSTSASMTVKTTRTAKERLIAVGVKFIDENLEPCLSDDKLLTYYVVNLTWYAH